VGDLAWQTGRLSFNDAPLGEIVAKLNRYSDRQVILADQALGALRLSGTFVSDRPAAFVDAATQLLPVDAESRADGAIVLRAR
jgi:transmembrane sensor